MKTYSKLILVFRIRKGMPGKDGFKTPIIEFKRGKKKEKKTNEKERMSESCDSCYTRTNHETARSNIVNTYTIIYYNIYIYMCVYIHTYTHIHI